ncbi:MAG: DsbC family protein [Woeseiaceae bacterium]|nr:DsbC family protein [Woeseiaceae bacterium]
MSRFSWTFRTLTVTLLWGVTAASAADDPKLAAVQEKVTAMFEAIEPKDVSKSPVDGWYTVQKGSIVAYISEDGRYLLQGDLIDLDMQVNLSEVSRSDARRELIASLQDEQTILFTPSDVKHSVTVFTDIDCSFCRKLHAQIDGYLERGIEVRYVLYPRNGPASRAWSTSEDVWCSRDRGEALTAAKLDRKFQTSKCDASMVSTHYMLGQDIGLSGTPAIVFEDGTLIGGYLQPAALEVRLKGTSPH